MCVLCCVARAVGNFEAVQFLESPQQLKERTGVERLLVLFLSKCSGQTKRALQVGGLPESPPVSGGQQVRALAAHRLADYQSLPRFPAVQVRALAAGKAFMIIMC